jgi:DUF971 family protein
MASAPMPIELAVAHNRRSMTVVWDELRAELTAERLRVESPSAEVKGHFGKGGVTPMGKADVTITRVEPVGNYAVKLVFSDGHATGIYTWDYLYAMATPKAGMPT